MLVEWQACIDAARVYVDDDHTDDDSWLKPAQWLRLFNVEYAQLYRRWLRAGLIGPAYTETAFTGNTVTINSVVAVIGVAEDLGGTKRLLSPAQSKFGRAPFWSGTNDTGKSAYWEASGSSDTLTLTLHPSDVGGSYVVRYITYPAYQTVLADGAGIPTTVDVPYGGDERLILGAARRAHLKDSVASRLLDELIRDADAELNFTAFARQGGDSPRVRRVKSGLSHNDRFGSVYPMSPLMWSYF